LYRCIIILWLLLAPVLVVWFFSAPVLLFLGQEERLSYDVQAFLRVLIFGAPAYLGFESVKKYLQCQGKSITSPENITELKSVVKGIMHGSTLVLLVTSPLNGLLSYLLVHRTRLGFIGAPVAISITYHLAFLLIIAYTRWGPGPPSSEDEENSEDPSHSPTSSATLGSPADPEPEDDQMLFSSSKHELVSTSLSLPTILAPRHVWGFLQLAVPGILMVATEWWAFEIVALAAGRLGRLPLAAQGVVMTADQSEFLLSFVLTL